eukprot:scaffold458427_cov37-Prasinocladus_malaysianus.AAC.1
MVRRSPVADNADCDVEEEEDGEAHIEDQVEEPRLPHAAGHSHHHKHTSTVKALSSMLPWQTRAIYYSSMMSLLSLPYYITSHHYMSHRSVS